MINTCTWLILVKLRSMCFHKRQNDWLYTWHISGVRISATVSLPMLGEQYLSLSLIKCWFPGMLLMRYWGWGRWILWSKGSTDKCQAKHIIAICTAGWWVGGYRLAVPRLCLLYHIQHQYHWGAYFDIWQVPSISTLWGHEWIGV